jgi:hypothetical protein
MAKRTLVILLFVILSVTCAAPPLAASPETSDWGGVRFNMEAVLEDVDHMAVTIIAVIRTLAAILSVILVIFIGLNIWKSADSYVLHQVKNQLFLLFIGLTLIFTTEPLVRFLLSLFNW